MRVYMRRALVLAGATATALGCVAGLTGTALAATAHQAANGGTQDQQVVLIANLVPSVPGDPAIFGVSPGGLPWVISHGEAVLDGGFLEVNVAGLVVPTIGTNPVPDLAASVYCNGMLAETTATVPFSPAGNARLHAKVTLPSFCPAPAVLLNPATTPTHILPVYIAFTSGS